MPSRYTSMYKIVGVKDSVNLLRFSYVGNWLAAADDDGAVTILDYISGEVMDEVKDNAPASALAWHKTKATFLFIGYADGRVVLYDVKNKQMMNSMRPLGMDGPVECMEHTNNGRSLVLSCGPEVIVCQLSENEFLNMTRLPAPERVNLGEEPLSVRSIHLMPGDDLFIVSYLAHGVVCWNAASRAAVWILRPRSLIGCTALSPDAKCVVAYNLYDGFDCYELRTGEIIYTIKVNIAHNVPIPALFIHNGRSLLLGSSCGKVTVWSTSSHTQEGELRHNDKSIIQAIAYTENNGFAYIATGTSEQHPDDYLRVWTEAGNQDVVRYHRRKLNSKKAMHSLDSDSPQLQAKIFPVRRGVPVESWLLVVRVRETRNTSKPWELMVIQLDQ